MTQLKSFMKAYTDTHIQLNEYDGQASKIYFDSLSEAISSHGFDIVRMSNLLPDNRPMESVLAKGGLLKELTKSASRRYQGEKNITDVAQAYYQQNLVEREIIQENFPDAIFLTYNGSKMNPIFPKKMPIFHMYSTKKGDSEKPWFK